MKNTFQLILKLIWTIPYLLVFHTAGIWPVSGTMARLYWFKLLRFKPILIFWRELKKRNLGAFNILRLKLSFIMR